MSTELYATLSLLVTNIIIFLINVIGEWFYDKDKKVVKETSIDYGLVLLGVAESTLVIFLCFLFG